MPDTKGDLRSKEDIKLMVDTFYDKVNEDDLLSYIFNDFAKTNWDTHLPKMYAFWNKVLFAKGDYKGNPFRKHTPLPVKKEHFDRWIALFEDNMDEHFSGEMAEDAKLRARSIAYIFHSKLNFMNA